MFNKLLCKIFGHKVEKNREFCNREKSFCKRCGCELWVAYDLIEMLNNQAQETSGVSDAMRGVHEVDTKEYQDWQHGKNLKARQRLDYISSLNKENNGQNTTATRNSN